MHPALLIVILFVLHMVQSTWLSVPAFSWIRVDLCFILLMFISFFRGPVYGLVCGSLIGLVLDITTGTFIGGQLFTYALLGYFAGTFFKMFLNKYLLLFTVTIMILSVVNVLLQFGIHQLFTSTSVLQGISSFKLTPIINLSIAHMVYNAVISLFLYPLAARWIPSHRRRRLIEGDA